MTIGYNRLGSNGRLGNQMFQYAALRGIATNRGYEFMIPPPDDKYEANYGLFDCFKMESVIPKNFGFVPHKFASYKLPEFRFYEDFFNECPDDCNLDDYFQSCKWFDNVKDLIRSDFTFKNEILEPCMEMIKDVGECISIHVRRTDYVNLQSYHPICSLDYYVSALEEFSDNMPVLVFSDDIEWCGQQEIFSGDRFLLSQNEERYNHLHKDADGQMRHSLVPDTDLCLMSLCSHNIIANSSFSWWGAWLNNNPNKKIVAPDRWFGDAAKISDTSDLVPLEWIRKPI